LLVEVINYFFRGNLKANLSLITVKSIGTIVASNNIDDIKDAVKNTLDLIASGLERENQHDLAFNNAKAYIEKYYMKDISLDEISMVAGYSKSHFSRTFKEKMGVNFSRYLVHVRIENAEKLLTNSSQSINDISIEVGFNDYSYFSKAFKDAYGLSPKDYRKNKKSKS
ncbi:helix-turn-helix domain-containing protein, partial [Peptoniphilus asaccharolyticus]